MGYLECIKPLSENFSLACQNKTLMLNYASKKQLQRCSVLYHWVSLSKTHMCEVYIGQMLHASSRLWRWALQKCVHVRWWKHANKRTEATFQVVWFPSIDFTHRKFRAGWQFLPLCLDFGLNDVVAHTQVLTIPLEGSQLLWNKPNTLTSQSTFPHQQ